MKGCIAVRWAFFLAVVPTLGCAQIRTRTADFSEFNTAETLRLVDYGASRDKTAQRSATISDPHKVVAVADVLRSIAGHWEPVSASPPSARFTLFSFKDDKLADWMWIDSPREDGTAYMQMKIPGAGMYCTRINEKDFDKLLQLFGVSNWHEKPKNQEVETAKGL